MEFLETLLHSFANLAILLFEYIGVGVITFAGIQGIVNYVRKSPNTRLILARGLAMGLEFKLGSEILRTVIIRNIEEIFIVAGIILLRAVLTILIHWEIKNEQTEPVAEPQPAETTKADSDSKATDSDLKSADSEKTDSDSKSTDSEKTDSDSKSTDSEKADSDSKSTDSGQADSDSESN